MKHASGALVFLLGLGALVFATWWLLRPARSERGLAGPPPFVVPVTLVEAEVRDLAPRARLTGSLRSARRARLGFDAAGLVVELSAQEADTVTAGALLARLDDRDARLEAMVAEDALALAGRELELLEAGERVEEIRRLEAELAAARAEEELARLEVERGGILLEDRVLSQSEQDARVAAASAAKERANAARERLARANAGARAEDLAIAQARVAAARTRLSAAEHEITKSELRAPWGGVVVSRMVSPGDYVSAGEEVFELVDLEHLEAHVEIPARLAGQVAAGAAVTLALPGDLDFRLRASLTATIPAADERSRSFRGIVRLGPEELSGSPLRPGMFCALELELARWDGALAVPSDCVLVGEAGSIVVRASRSTAAPPGDEPQGDAPPAYVADLVPVRVLAEADGWKAIETLAAPIVAGDTIVLAGADNAFPGAPLFVRAPEAAAPAPEAGRSAPAEASSTNGGAGEEPRG